MVFRKLLIHDNPNLRLFSLWVLGVLLCWVAWQASWAFLPEGVLRDIFVSSKIDVEADTASQTMSHIVLFNVGFAGLVIALANLFRVGWFPLGYIPVLFHWSLFGVFMGTGSFSASDRGKAAPDFLQLVSSIGFAEISAYTFIAAATVGLWQYNQRGFLALSSARTRRLRDITVTRCDLIAIAAALFLLLASGWREGAGLVAA